MAINRVIASLWETRTSCLCNDKKIPNEGNLKTCPRPIHARLAMHVTSCNLLSIIYMILANQVLRHQVIALL